MWVQFLEEKLTELLQHSPLHSAFNKSFMGSRRSDSGWLGAVGQEFEGVFAVYLSEDVVWEEESVDVPSALS